MMDNSTEHNGSVGVDGFFERKRELERRRRETLHTRLSELDSAVAPYRKRIPSRKWDKELILSDALQVISSLQDQLKEVTATLEEMRVEADELRGEKLELRNDKAYLREEVEAVRAENRKLRADNIALWQAIRNQSPDQGLASLAKSEPAKAEPFSKRVSKISERTEDAAIVEYDECSKENACDEDSDVEHSRDSDLEVSPCQDLFEEAGLKPDSGCVLSRHGTPVHRDHLILKDVDGNLPDESIFGDMYDDTFGADMHSNTGTFLSELAMRLVE
uniref:BHLH domain-containing protein n=1 Tax=Timspurckia oligopyrenoides TaxID=708627 RepID=A0A7S0ZGC2_9RHOD|mmetsp:Transcript_4032/g.7075  ORF Transcript_4032/g.7075 Transcript_4032/m.7075 type:complete len:275 (+) Transcript_4032:196-1020(+)